MPGCILMALPYVTVPARRISESILPLNRFRGEVQSIFRGAVNVETDGWLVTFAVPTSGGLPNGILVDHPTDLRLLGLRPGDPVSGAEDGIVLPTVRLWIDLKHADRWAPGLKAMPSAEAADRWRVNRTASWEAAARGAGAIGFGPLIRRQVWNHSPTHLSPFCIRAAPAIGVVRSRLAANDTATAAAAASELVGLGPGATPSGDDFIVGLAAALVAASRTAGIEIAAESARRARDRTTLIAATLLRHAARGEFSERLHTLLAVLLGSRRGNIQPAITEALTWGASSGADCLLGVLVGLDSLDGTTG